MGWSLLQRCLLGLLVLSQGFLAAASAEGPISIERDYLVRVWETEDGFPHIAATCMAQTDDGYLWVGSFGGLVRFDGSRFTSIDPSTTPALAGNPMVLSLVVARDGALWVGSSKGIARLKDGRWKSFGAEAGYPGGRIWSLNELPDGAMLVSVDTRFFRIANDRVSPTERPPTPAGKNTQFSCVVDGEGIVWAMSTHSIFRLQQGRWNEFARIELDDVDAGFLGMYAAKSGGVWIAEYRQIRLWRGGAWVRTLERPAGFTQDGLSLIEDSAGGLWAGGYVNGILRYGPDGTVARATLAEGLQNNSTIALFEDDEANVWAGSNGGGLARLKPRSFTVFGRQAGTPQPVVNSLAETAPGRFLVATHGAGVLPFDGARYGAPLPQTVPGRNPAWAFGIVTDSAGALLVGSYLDGLFRVAGDHLVPLPTGQTGSDTIRGLFSDTHGRLWVGTDKGVAVRETEVFRTFGPPDGLPAAAFHAFALDGEGTLWTGSRSAGLFRLAGGRFLAEQPTDSATAAALAHVTALFADRQGTLWVGTGSGALLRRENGRFFRYDPRHGLPAWSWNGLVEDARGDLWAGSSEGIVRFRRASLDAVARNAGEHVDVQTFDSSDGLNSIVCRDGVQPVCLRASDGRLWFATIKGLAVVDPARVRVVARPPRVKIEQVLADGRPLPEANAAGESVVPAGTKRLTVRYTGVSLGAAQRVRFSHRLAGLDHEWIERGSDREAEFLDLAPGRYVFQIRARNVEGQESAGLAQIALRIRPFFWQTLAFRGTAVVVLLGLFGGGLWRAMNLRYRRQQERLDHERQLLNERTRAEEASSAKAAADAASRAKSEFLAVMSHEIRTPLNGVIGGIELLKDTSLTPSQEEIVGILRVSAEALQSLINDILDFSRIEAGRIDLEHIAFDPRQPAAEVLEIVTAAAAAKQLELVLHCPPGLPALVLGDATRLRQVLLNLVHNAVKFTPAGHVVLRIAPTEPGSARLRYSVTDTGIGIAPDRRGHLFEKFTQADASTTRRFGGTGLGLAIAKRLVELMGGTIGVDSEPNRGSTFWFELPLEVDTDTAEPPNRPTARQLLVVDDLPVARESLAILLAGMQADHATLSSVAEMLALLRRTLPAPTPPVLLLDQSVVAAEGASMLAAMRGDPYLAALPLVLLAVASDTSDVPPELAERLVAVINKPVVQPDQIIEMLRELDRTPAEAPIRPLGPVPRLPAGCRILVAEDNAVNRTVLAALLRKLGCTVDFAEHGAAAVAKARADRYDAILMDCLMPEMDGWQATREIRSGLGPERTVPIIAVTANVTEADRLRSFESGMNDFLAKPVRQTVLCATLGRWVNKPPADFPPRPHA